MITHKKNNLPSICTTTLSVATLFVFYAQVTYARTLKDIITDNVIPIFDSAINFIMVLAVLSFIVGVIRFMYTSGDDKSRQQGKNLMIWGTIALAVMVSVWGLVMIIKTTFFG
ncbi:MAG: hypothetical protein KBD24_03345 [Candidatus Pacebacteria bacterium]|nr:hypothetical protein [Candidatus Paceibacterota bacterium]